MCLSCLRFILEVRIPIKSNQKKANCLALKLFLNWATSMIALQSLWRFRSNPKQAILMGTTGESGWWVRLVEGTGRTGRSDHKNVS